MFVAAISPWRPGAAFTPPMSHPVERAPTLPSLRPKRPRRERSGTRRPARPLSTSRVEIAIEITGVAHARDTTLEKRSPDHLAMIGAPVQQLVAEFERRRYGSAWRAGRSPLFAERNGTLSLSGSRPEPLCRLEGRAVPGESVGTEIGCGTARVDRIGLPLVRVPCATDTSKAQDGFNSSNAVPIAWTVQRGRATCGA